MLIQSILFAKELFALVIDAEFTTYFLIVDLVSVEDFHHHFVLDVGFRGVQLVEATFDHFGGWSMREVGIFDCLLATDDRVLGESLELTLAIAFSGVEPCLYLDRLAFMSL
jgi:hypothetical protein